MNLSTTPSTQYVYSEMAGGVNNSRQTEMIYPNGRTLDYNYNTGLDSDVSRLSSISDASNGNSLLESYSYLGDDTPLTITEGNGMAHRVF